MKSFLRTAVTAVALGTLPTLSMAGGNLVISANTSDAAPRAAFEELVDKFPSRSEDFINNLQQSSLNEVLKVSDIVSIHTPLTDETLNMIDENFLSRHLNVGFSGGEKKKNEILQLKILEPKLAILDETDSGLDIDALKIVADGVNSYKNKDNSFLIITHYQRLLNFIKPDFIHVLSAGKIIKTGSKELGKELEKTGYTNLI